MWLGIFLFISMSLPILQVIYMGITGLLPVLKPITKQIHIRELRGQRVAVDGYVWLHRGVYSCSAELMQGLESNKYVEYCVRRTRMLLEHEIKVTLVLDGKNLPAKEVTEEQRRAQRVKKTFSFSAE